MPPEADVIRLRHMMEASQQAMEFVQGRSRTDLDSDQMLTFALVRALEIVGEAASKVSLETRAEYPQLPWPSIIGMRNRIIHAYFDVDLDRVWDTVVDDLPALISELRLIVPA